MSLAFAKRQGFTQFPSGCPFTRIMNQPPGFSSIAAASAARGRASERQIASVSYSSPHTYDRSPISYKVNLFDLHHKYADVMQGSPDSVLLRFE
jgi:hypothetical protein